MLITEKLPELDLKKITSLATVVTLVILTYYVVSTYKTALEIKQIKKNNNTDK